jgi:hypothetical protein
VGNSVFRLAFPSESDPSLQHAVSLPGQALLPDRSHTLTVAFPTANPKNMWDVSSFLLKEFIVCRTQIDAFNSA